MRQASQASKTRVLRLKEPLSVRTEQFCRIGRAEPHNPAGISAYADHKHTERVFTQPGPKADNRTVEYFTARRGSDAIRHGKMEQTRPVAVIFIKPDVIAYE
jgi:hypothetical protein